MPTAPAMTLRHPCPLECGWSTPIVLEAAPTGVDPTVAFQVEVQITNHPEIFADVAEHAATHAPVEWLSAVLNLQARVAELESQAAVVDSEAQTPPV